MGRGVCKDRLADAFARFGRVPVLRRTTSVGPEHPAFLRPGPDPLWAAGGLVHDGEARVLLVRHRSPSAWGDRWLTPGGWLEEGETTLDGFRREVREEVGIEVVEPALTRIVLVILTSGDRNRPTYFAQFVARARSPEARPAPDVAKAQWFSDLPLDMAFREDYLEDFLRLQGGTF